MNLRINTGEVEAQLRVLGAYARAGAFAAGAVMTARSNGEMVAKTAAVKAARRRIVQFALRQAATVAFYFALSTGCLVAPLVFVWIARGGGEITIEEHPAATNCLVEAATIEAHPAGGGCR